MRQKTRERETCSCRKHQSPGCHGSSFQVQNTLPVQLRAASCDTSQIHKKELLQCSASTNPLGRLNVEYEANKDNLEWCLHSQFSSHFDLVSQQKSWLLLTRKGVLKTIFTYWDCWFWIWMFMFLLVCYKSKEKDKRATEGSLDMPEYSTQSNAILTHIVPVPICFWAQHNSTTDRKVKQT